MINRKYFRTILFFIFSFLFIELSSCSHISSSDDDYNNQIFVFENTNPALAKISGFVIDTTQIGAIPSNSRTALPSTLSVTEPRRFKVSAKNTGGSSILTGEVTITGTTISYSINLPVDEWTITVELFETYNAATNEQINCIMKGSKVVTVAAGATLLPVNIELYFVAHTEGTGSAKLKIETEFACNRIHITCNTHGTCLLSTDYTSGTLIENIPEGTHNVAFEFYDSANTRCFYFTELINIFSGCVTDVWKSQASYISTDGTKIYLTSALVEKYKLKTFYVCSTGYDTNSGSFFLPLRTVQEAVNTITTINDGITEYGIVLLDDFIKEVSSHNLVEIDPSSTLKLKISSYSSNHKINAEGSSRVLYIGTNASVTLENITITNGSISGQGGGIYVAGTLNVNNGTKITNNIASECGGGIYGFNGTLNFSGNSEISGNTATGTESLNGGGGIYLEKSTLTSGTATSVLLKNNKAYKNGGGLLVSQKSNATLKNFEIAENKANSERANNNYMGGGIYVVADASDSSINASTLSIENSSVYGNEVIYGYGGGIFIDKNCNFNLNRETIIGNATKPNGACSNFIGETSGNGIYAKNCSMTFDGNITIFENEAIALKNAPITLTDHFEQPTYTILLQPETYTVGTQILTGAGLEKYTSFKVQNEDWEISSDGKLQKVEIAKKFIQITDFSGLKTASEWGTLPSETKTILISTLGDLQTLAEWNKTVAIENHVFLLTTNISVPSDWYGLGVDQTFITTFDGNGYTITFNNTSCGLVRILSRNGYIKNLTIDGSISFNQNIGGIVSTVKGSSTIENCVNKAAINNSSASQSFYTGGIVGKKQSGLCKIINCINEGTITAPSCKYVGGIVGGTDSGYNTEVENCANIGSIGSANSTYVGGIIGGTFSNDIVTNSYNNGVINGTGNYVASIAGYHNSSMTIEHCYFNSSKCSKVYENSTSDPNITAFSSSSALETSLNSWIEINDSAHITYYNWETKTGSSTPTLKYSR